MNSEWRLVKVKDLGTIVTGRTPPGGESDYYGDEIPFLTPSDFGDLRKVEITGRYLSKAGAERMSKVLVPSGVGISCIGWQMGKAVLIDTPTITNQQINSIIIDDEDIDRCFVYYSLSTRRHEFFTLGSGGSRTPILNKTDFGNLDFWIPPVSEQKAIALILGTLDDKIELNRKTNETLEDIAKALFRSWFVDFDPVRAKAAGRPSGLPDEISDLFPDSFEESGLGEIPIGWRSGDLNDLANLNPESWSAKNHPSELTYVDLSGTKNGKIEESVTYKWSDAPSRARRVLKEGDTIVGTVRPGNRSFSLVQQVGLTGSTGFAVVRPKQLFNTSFLYVASTSDESIDRLDHLADGGAYPAVRPEVVMETPITVPSQPIQILFGDITDSLFRKISVNNKESAVLEQLRDALLPRLISGELRVPDAEKMLEEVGI